MIKIAHISDIHMRNYQYMDEMEFTFDRLYESLEVEKPDIVVITGDTFHSKITPTHEYFNMAINFFRRLSDLYTVIVIPGNHDAALNNKTRMDAITPVINALNSKNIIYSKTSEEILCPERVTNLSETAKEVVFHHFSILENKKNWPKKEDIDSEKINIVLYHGSINGCKVDNGWISRGNKDSLSIFDGFDFALLGDIHICQFLDEHNRVGYAGSLRQNNYGESVDKGYLIWEIESKEKFEVRRVILEQKRYFFTIYGESVEDVKNLGDLAEDSRIRFVLTKDVNFAEQLKIKSEIEKLYKPHDEVIIIPPNTDNNIGSIKVGEVDILHENIRQPEVQKQLIREYFKDKKLSEEELKEISNLDKRYHSYVETDVKRNVTFDLKTMKFSNTFSFGKSNIIDFRKKNGLIGIFGPNASGKSAGIVDNLSLGLYNQITKEGVNKNIEFINRLCSNASIEIDYSMNNKNYLIKRTYKRKKVKNGEDCETTIDFWKTKGKEKESLNGEKKPDTNKNIRKEIGTDEDFSFTSLCAQFNLTNFIDAKGTKRKESLAKYYDLGIFDTKYQIAKKDYDILLAKLSDLDYSKIETEIETKKMELDVSKNKLLEICDHKVELEQKIENFEREIRKEYQNFIQSKYSKKDLEEVEKKIRALQGEKQQINEKISEYSKFVKDFSHMEKTYENYEKESVLLSTELESLNNLINELQKDKENNEKISKLIKKIPNVPQCKVCPLVENAFEASEKLVEINKKIEESINKLEVVKDKIKALDFLNDWKKSIDSQTEIDYYKGSLEEIERRENEISETQREIQENIQNINCNVEVQQRIDTLEEQIKTLKGELNNSNGELISINKRIAVDEEKIKEFSESLKKTEKLNKEKYYFSLYLDAMGKNGISYWIISKKIPLLNRQVNYILSHCVNFKLFIEDNDSEKSLKIYIVDEKGKRPVELGSGMEKTISSIALRAALWKTCLLPKTSILILDESFAHLDAEKSDGIVKLLVYLKTYFNTIFLITHDEGLKGMVDHTFYVTKDNNGMSKLEIK